MGFEKVQTIPSTKVVKGKFRFSQDRVHKGFMRFPQRLQVLPRPDTTAEHLRFGAWGLGFRD